MSRDLVICTESAAHTHALGALVGAELRGGEFLALTGALGAGKTQFVKGLALGLGVPEDEPVLSPTFVLVREYQGRVRLYHIDAYRLGSAEELNALGVEEMARPDAVVAIEWADRVRAAIPDGALWLDFSHGPASAEAAAAPVGAAPAPAAPEAPPDGSAASAAAPLPDAPVRTIRLHAPEPALHRRLATAVADRFPSPAEETG